MVAISPWVFPGFAGLGQLSQTSDRLYSCGFADRQSRPWSATGAGGFEVLIANCKFIEREILGGGEVGWRGAAPVTAGDWRLRAVATLALGIPSLVGGGKLSQTSDRLVSCGLVDGRRLFSGCGGGGRLLKF